MHLGYVQASLALDYGKQLSNAAFPFINKEYGSKQDSRVFEFEDYHIFCLLSKNNLDQQPKQIFQKSFCSKILFEIHEYDKKHTQYNLQLLYTYLIYERRASETPVWGLCDSVKATRLKDWRLHVTGLLIQEPAPTEASILFWKRDSTRFRLQMFLKNLPL